MKPEVGLFEKLPPDQDNGYGDTLTSQPIKETITDEGCGDALTQRTIRETPRSWFILAVSSMLIFIHGLGVFTPPIYYVAYVDYFRVSKSLGAWVNSIYPLCCFSIGIVSSAFTARYGCCVTTFIGGAILFTSQVISAFSPNIIMIFIFQGALAGCGAGISFINANVILTKYFDRYRALASSLSYCFLGLAMFVGPALITYLIGQYGWRGAVLIQGGIMGHMMPLALFLGKPQLKKLTNNIYLNRQIATNDIKKHGQLMSQKEKESPHTKIMKSMFDFSLLKNTLFLLYCLSNILTRVNSNMLVPHLPSYIITQGFSLEQAALVATVTGGCSVASRFVSGMMSLYKHLNHIAVYGIVMLFNGVSSILLLYLKGLVGKCVAAVVFGLAFGFDYPFVPVILVQLQGVDNLAKALALYNIITMAPVIAAMAPIGGVLYDQTGSYTVPFLLGCVAATLGSLLSFLLAYLVYKKDSKHAKNSAIQTNFMRGKL